jgi:multisubunit Na+/H+ antiporter MnhE subunit
MDWTDNMKTPILEFIICFILYLIISKFIDINFGSFILGLIFPTIVIIISHVLKGLVK